MKLAPQRLKPCSSVRYIVRAYGGYEEQRKMKAAANRLWEAMSKWAVA